MAGTGFSGVGGTAKTGSSGATELVEVTKWTFDPTVSVGSYNSNNTGGHKRKVPGVADSKGTIEIKVSDTTAQQLAPGDVVSLQLYADQDILTPSYIDIIEAVISGAPVECDIDGGEVVGMTYNFEASDWKGYAMFASDQYGAVV